VWYFNSKSSKCDQKDAQKPIVDILKVKTVDGYMLSDAPVEERIGGWNVAKKQYTEVEYVVVK
jgi:hypothetical protein